MKRRLKRIGLVAGTLILLLFVFVWMEHVRGRRALNEYLNLLRANGEAYSVAALEPKHPPADQNAFVDLTRIKDQLESLVKDLDDEPPPVRFSAPGREIVSWRLDQWGRNTNITQDWSRLGPELDEARELLDSLAATVRKPAYDSGFDYSQGGVDFRPVVEKVEKVQRDAAFLYAAAIHDLHSGSLNIANRDLCALVRLEAVQKPEPLLICQLIREGYAYMAFDAIWQALQAPGWSDDQLADLQEAWDDCDFAGDMGRALRMERATSFDFYEQIKASEEKFDIAENQEAAQAMLWPGTMRSPLARGFLPGWLHLPFWRLAWADQEELFALRHQDASIARERFARTNSLAALYGKPGSTSPAESQYLISWSERLRFRFSNKWFSVNDNAICKAIIADADKNMAVTAIAIYRYRLQTGAFPDTLERLVPKYLPTPPQDNMDGKILRYKLKPDGSFLLYSVGTDGRDDGGDNTQPTPIGGFYQIWNCRDAVWPTPATDAEALNAMKSLRN